MTLEELRPLVQTLPKRLYGFGGFSHWAVLIVKPHARKAWGGAAHIESDDMGYLRIIGNGTSAPYACSFEDLMATDWEIVTP